ncbi:adenine deaminase [Halalkalibacter urbisdiaboli]|uniref:adenine deaminase n=1 Tax=Halalkalibacter urbisdiaboli TaxID=1960589 RepID=UPI000B4446CB|nr:adenine deaminase [Halalkalibacter urbisdiaboli]
MEKQLKNRVAMATKRQPADIVVKNGKIIDVFNLEIIEQDLAIGEGYIVGIGQYEGMTVIDAKGQYICPAFIDGHVHIESAMVPPEEFANIVVPRGVTTVMADPHEIANVAGVTGIQYMIDASKDIPLDVKIMVPSCVPATSFENNGATVTATEIATLFQKGEVYGLGEVMDYPSVLNGEDEMVKKLLAAKENQRIIDGHAAGLDINGLNAYRTMGISNDHEAVTADEALERLRRGMYVLIREGTAAKDLEALVNVVTPYNARRCVFATDDKHLDDLVGEGSVDASIRKAISLGLDPLQVIQMASLNAAECFQIGEKGAIAPGYEANFLFIESLESVNIQSVYVRGKKVAEDGKIIAPARKKLDPPAALTDSVHVKSFDISSLQLPIRNHKKVHVIKTNPGSIMTEHLIEEVMVEDGMFLPSVKNNQLKLIVAERHKKLGNIGVGVLKGIPMTNGAIVATVAHDSHNIVACGTDDESIYHAMNHVISLRGGVAVVKGSKVLASLSLPLAGLMSLEPFEKVNESLHALEGALQEIGFLDTWNPFLTLSFLALPVIPSLKLTDKGLFDVDAFCHIEASSENE